MHHGKIYPIENKYQWQALEQSPTGVNGINVTLVSDPKTIRIHPQINSKPDMIQQISRMHALGYGLGIYVQHIPGYAPVPKALKLQPTSVGQALRYALNLCARICAVVCAEPEAHMGCMG